MDFLAASSSMRLKVDCARSRLALAAAVALSSFGDGAFDFGASGFGAAHAGIQIARVERDQQSGLRGRGRRPARSPAARSPSLCWRWCRWCGRGRCRWLRSSTASPARRPRWRLTITGAACGCAARCGRFTFRRRRGAAARKNQVDRASLVQYLRIRVETSRGKFEHGGGNTLVVYGCQITGAAFEHGGLGAQAGR